MKKETLEKRKYIFSRYWELAKEGLRPEQIFARMEKEPAPKYFIDSESVVYKVYSLLKERVPTSSWGAGIKKPVSGNCLKRYIEITKKVKILLKDNSTASVRDVLPDVLESEASSLFLSSGSIRNEYFRYAKYLSNDKFRHT